MSEPIEVTYKRIIDKLNRDNAALVNQNQESYAQGYAAALEDAAKVADEETFTGTREEEAHAIEAAKQSSSLTVMLATMTATKESIAKKIRALRAGGGK